MGHVPFLVRGRALLSLTWNLHRNQLKLFFMLVDGMSEQFLFVPVRINRNTPSILASTSNHEIHIWNVEDENRPLVATLRKHQRPVTDASWSPLHPSILATSSVDSCVHLWDTRAPSDPIQTFRVPHNGAQRVEWNRIDFSLLASAHDKQLCIWDTRKGSERGSNISIFTAHTQQITGLDWSHTSAKHLVTASADRTVKLWTTENMGSNNVGTSLAILQREVPLQRVIFTPFGNGVVTTSRGIGEQIDAPQTVRLWSLTNLEDGFVGVHIFEGPCMRVLGACWRVVDGHLYQLVSLDKSGHLRLHRVHPQHLQACGHGADDDTHHNEDASDELGLKMVATSNKITLNLLKQDLLPSLSLQNRPVLGQQGVMKASLWGEILDVDGLADASSIPGVIIKQVDWQAQTFHANIQCSRNKNLSELEQKSNDMIEVSIEQDHATRLEDQSMANLSVLVAFPAQCLLVKTPTFTLSGEINGNPMPQSLLDALQQEVDRVAKQALQAGVHCLVNCLRTLALELNKEIEFGCLCNKEISASDMRDIQPSTKIPSEVTSESLNLNDVSGFLLPCPRLFGANFSPSGELVIFCSGLKLPKKTQLPASGNLDTNSNLSRKTYSELLACVSMIDGYQNSHMYRSKVYRESFSAYDFIENNGYSSSDSGSNFEVQNDSMNEFKPTYSTISEKKHNPWSPVFGRVTVLNLKGILPGSQNLSLEYNLGKWHRKINSELIQVKRGSQISKLLEKNIVLSNDGLSSVKENMQISSNSSFSKIESLVQTPQHTTLSRQKQWDSTPDFNILRSKGLYGRKVPSGQLACVGEIPPITGRLFGSLPKNSLEESSRNDVNNDKPRRVNSAGMNRARKSHVLDSTLQLMTPKPPPTDSSRILETIKGYSKSFVNLNDSHTMTGQLSKQKLSTINTSCAEVKSNPQFSPLMQRIEMNNLEKAENEMKDESSSEEKILPGIMNNKNLSLTLDTLVLNVSNGIDRADLTPCTNSHTEMLDISSACAYNAIMANQYEPDNPDLSAIWSLLSESSNAEVSGTQIGPDLFPFRDGAFGSRLRKKIFDHFSSETDIQTCATIICVLNNTTDIIDQNVHNCYLYSYSELLHNWGHLERRLEVLKHLKNDENMKKCGSFTADDGKLILNREMCKKCEKENDRKCSDCLSSVFQCVICNLSVRGMGTFCPKCFHGGHAMHMESWFSEYSMCPTGCGCECITFAKNGTDTVLS